MNSSTRDTTHFDDTRLAALNDSELSEREAEQLRAHLEGCQDCRSRQEQLARIGRDLGVAPVPSAALVSQVQQRALRPDEPRAWRRPWLVAAPALAAAAGVVLFVWSGRAPVDDGFQARGGETGRPSVQLTLFRVGDQLERLESGAELRAGLQRLAVEVKHLPARAPRAVAVYARDVSGRVTWIRPTWVEADERPACLKLPSSAGVIAPSEGVELELAPGALEVGFLVLSGACDLPTLDQKLEAGWRPSPDAEHILQAQRLQLEVSSE